MFYNIFKKTNNKIKSIITPLIIADIHEKNSLILAELKSSAEVRLEIKSLKIADYLISDIAIERKTVSDLISSIINKRLIQQIQQLKKYNKSLLIIEGNLNEIYEKNNNISKSVRGFILSVIYNQYIPIIFSKDYLDTCKYLITLAKQLEKTKTTITLHSRIPKTIEEQKKYILEAFPKIGPKKADKLLQKFITLNKVFNASDEELNEILKNQTKEFRDILHI